MKEYNGHPSWEHWNVSLWICNNEMQYRMAYDYAQDVARGDMSLDMASREFQWNLASLGVSKTPDGAEYRLPYIKHALAGLID